ncbi:MAG: FtsX-like permease family protein [Gemmatimonadales bacterium]|nr:MAG: FtsX-like permease family protein [Gemmatimonadales bacterium]
MNLDFVVRHAFRESRSGIRRVGFFTLAVALGVAVLVGLRSLQVDVEEGARAEAGQLLGGDIRLEANVPFSPEVTALLDSLEMRGHATARVVSVASVATVPGTDLSRLVQLEGVGPGFPLRGSPTADPAGAWDRVLRGEGVAIGDPSLLGQFGLEVGDTLSLGGFRVPIVGVVGGLPVDPGARTVVGSPLYLSLDRMEASGLAGPGSVARHRALVRTATGTSTDALAEELREVLPADGRITVRTAQEQAEGLANAFGYLAGFLGLVGLAGLLLGGVGVGSAIHAFLKDRVPSVAVLRCLGVDRGSVFGAYVLLALLMGVAGAALGVVGGVALQFLVPRMPGVDVPFSLAQAPRPGAMAAGMLTGTWVTLLFALIPLIRVRSIPPMAALRPTAAGEGATAGEWARRGAVGALLVLSLFALAAIQLRSPMAGAAVTVALALTLGALAGASSLTVRLLPRLVPAGAPFALRHAARALNRPGNQTRSVLVALGFGTFLLAAVAMVEANLRAGLTLERGMGGESALLFDIQTDQVDAVAALLRNEGLEPEPVPLIPASLREIDGVAIADLLEGLPPGERWPFRRLYRNTVRSDLDPVSEELVAGSWWSGAAPAGARPGDARISVEVDLAEQLGLEVGSRVVWDVQGIPVPSVVTSLREVDWGSFRPNFFVIFEPGSLDGAPATWMVLAPLGDAEARARLQTRVATDFPNVTFLDLSTILDTLENLTARVAGVLQALSAVLLAVGGAVLVASLLATRFERRREAALLRILGSSAALLRRRSLVEFLVLGGIAAGVGIVLAVGAGAALLHWSFDGLRTIPWGILVVLGIAVPVVAAVVGRAVVGDSVRVSPLELLREGG